LDDDISKEVKNLGIFSVAKKGKQKKKTPTSNLRLEVGNKVSFLITDKT
jgi:hypothetical protein